MNVTKWSWLPFGYGGDDKSNQDGSGELPGSPVHEAVGVEVQGLSEVHKEGSNQEDSKNVSSPSILLSS